MSRDHCHVVDCPLREARRIDVDDSLQRPCASGYGPLRERRRAPLRSAGAKRETHLTTDAISVNEGAFAKRDERLSSQRPLRERNPIEWVKLRSSMSWPELRSHLRAEARGVA